MGFGYPPLDAMEERYKFLTSHGISFAVFAASGGVQSAANENKFIITARGKTVSAALAEKYFKAGR
jgi:hypothetical protein